MKKFIAALLVIGLMLNACEPSPKDKLKKAQQELEDAAEEAIDDIKEVAEEAGEEFEEAAEEVEADTANVKLNAKKLKKKLLGKLKKKK
ncbi:MAG: YtxH domain-containing protein [Candidatus Marinimicrobia bacterium]|nr:YtxH domain-containing protein [Candidatus Neomarinimicrobiota bacterium]